MKYFWKERIVMQFLLTYENLFCRSSNLKLIKDHIPILENWTIIPEILEIIKLHKRAF